MATARTKGSTKTSFTEPGLTAKDFLQQLTLLRPKLINDNLKFFKGDDENIKTIGVRMGSIFALAKKFMQMPMPEIERLLQSDFYEARVGAVSIMDFQARDKKTTAERKKELFDLYIKRHNKINNWDLVDRSAPHVVGGYLHDKPRAVLYKLARSKDPNERRTAIVSTWFFIRQNDLDDTFKIANLLVNDKNESVNKAVGSWVREAGKRYKARLLDFLNKHAATMPRVTLRYAIEKLDKKQKEFYMKIKA
jgi:3-methyladenine DNA glycosylase AlkD